MGNFTIQCKQGDMLEISYVGYNNRKVQAGKGLNIVMEQDAKTLDEVTVVGVGYGKMRKSDLTGAIASVNSKDMKQGVITSTEQLLQGKVAGLSIVQALVQSNQGPLFAFVVVRHSLQVMVR